MTIPKRVQRNSWGSPRIINWVILSTYGDVCYSVYLEKVILTVGAILIENLTGFAGRRSSMTTISTPLQHAYGPDETNTANCRRL